VTLHLQGSFWLKSVLAADVQDNPGVSEAKGGNHTGVLGAEHQKPLGVI